MLIIDDNYNNQVILKEMLAIEDIQCHAASNAIEALNLLEKENTYQLAIVDYNMPLLNGDDLIVISSQKLQFQHTDFIMITGEEFSDIERMKLMTLGFQYIFKKSELRKGEFLSIIKQVLLQSKAA